MNINETSKVNNLWGDSSVEDVRTPHVVLREQASILTEITEGKLVGTVAKERLRDIPHSYYALSEAVNNVAVRMTPEVLGKSKQKQIEYAFSSILEIRVPSINNYSISIVQIDYPVKNYPLRITDLVTDNYRFKKCTTEAELNQALSKILSSAEVRRIVGGLLSEIRADEKEVNI